MSEDSQAHFQTVGPIRLPVFLTRVGVSEYRLYLFRFPLGDIYALEKGEVKGSLLPLVRMHSACNLAHLFGSQRCDCQAQLELALELIHHERKGLLVYVMNHEGRGAGALDHVRVYEMQDKGYDTVDAYEVLGLPIDARTYIDAACVLQWFGLHSVRLLTNNPKKIEALERQGFTITRQPLIATLNPYNESQLKAKVEKLGHLIPLGNGIRYEPQPSH
jgi:GTP cyclohydrolase II